MDRKVLKQNAKQQLGGGIFQNNWLMGLVVLLIEGAILSAVSFTGVGAIILAGPLSYGASKVFLRRVYGEENIRIETMFDGFKDDFSGTMLLGLMESIFIGLWSMLFVVPGIIKAYSYAMSFYIKVDHPEYDWQACMNASKTMMRGHKGELFVLDLSFIGWMIVGSLALGIGTLWVAPYMECTRANFYACLCAQNPAAPTAAPENVSFE